MPLRTQFLITILFLNFISSFAGDGKTVTSTLDNKEHSRNLNWSEVKTTQQLWDHYPERIRTVLTRLDQNQPALEKVYAYAQAGDTVAAAQALLAHYKTSNVANWLKEQPLDGGKTEIYALAEQILRDTISLREATVKIPKNVNGGWQWRFQGPDRDAEFGYSLNGHKYAVGFIEGWHQTGDEAYVSAYDRLIRDWIIHNPLPPESDSIYQVLSATGLDWRDIDEVIWRTLEAGNRLGVSWPQAFYHFQQSEAFTPAARLLMLSSIIEHANYLQKYHKKGHNWTTMEMNGLALVGLTFPELKESNGWANYAMEVMEQEINRQVYPDGLQSELSTKTQWVALFRFESIAENFRKAKRPVKESYLKRVEEMYNFLAYSMRPDGHQPLNNDSDREDLRPRVLKAAQKFQRPDWEWIATNGAAGQSPDGLPSIVFPWGGIHIMRNGWDGQAHWTFFDTGPFGSGHQHSDMLHLSVSAFGKDLLVDGGRFTHKDYFSFDPTIWRGYFRSTFSHNTLLVDGKGQNAGPLRANSPIKEGETYVNTPEFDYARGTFSNGYEKVEGEVSHSRAVLYVKGKFWVVVDHVETDRPRQIQALWHYAPSCSVNIAGKSVFSDNPGEANLQIIPVGKSSSSWQIDMIKGQEKPFIQGWYSADYGMKEPNPTAIYSQSIKEKTTFAWVLVPSNGKNLKVKAKLMEENEQGIQVRIQIRGQKPITVTVPWNFGKPEVSSP